MALDRWFQVTPETVRTRFVSDHRIILLTGTIPLSEQEKINDG